MLNQKHRRSQVLVDSLKRPLADQTPDVGKNLELKVHLPPTSDIATSSSEIITIFSPTNYTLAWKYTGAPEYLLYSERWQVLSRTPEGKTLYETREIFYGPLAYLVKTLMYNALIQGFETVANDLKSRVEQS
jgi:hypothetical protein